MRSARAAALVVVVGAAVAAAPATAAPCRPDIIDLGTLAGGRSVAFDIGPDGEIVGSATDADGRPRAVRWIGGRIEPLPVPGDSFALDVNRRGIVGDYAAHDGEPRPFLYRDGRVTDLPLLPGAIGGVARRINASGQIAGWVVGADGHEHAVIWTRGRIRDLGVPAGYTDGYAMAINDRGQVGGAVYNAATGDPVAVRWTRGHFELLPSLGGLGRGQVNVLDQRGRAAGFAETESSAMAAVWDRTGTVRGLGYFPGGDLSLAFGTDDHGNYVGTANYFPGERGGHVFISRGDGPLMTLRPLSGNPITGSSGAHGIDRHGNVAGSSATGDGAEHATLWTCAFKQAFVPAPPALAAAEVRGGLRAARRLRDIGPHDPDLALAGAPVHR
jgi:uncharacterized membrane protein